MISTDRCSRGILHACCKIATRGGVVFIFFFLIWLIYKQAEINGIVQMEAADKRSKKKITVVEFVMLLHCSIPSVDICNFPRPYRKVLKSQTLSSKCFWKQHHQHRYTKQLKLQHCTMLQTSLTRNVQEMVQQFKRHLQGRGKRWGRGGKLRLLTKDQTNSDCINSLHIFNRIAIILIYSARLPKAIPITSILYFCGYSALQLKWSSLRSALFSVYQMYL